MSTTTLSATDVQELHQLIPLKSWPSQHLEQWCSDIRIEEIPKGDALFHQGDDINELFYLLNGTVSLQAGGVEMELITGGTQAARFALAHQIPRKVSAIAKSTVRFVRMKSEAVIQTDLSSYESSVSPIMDSLEKSDRDWIIALLKSPPFQQLPRTNLEALLHSLEKIQVKAGDEICRQDTPGNYYYIVRSGKCVLSRKPFRLSKEVKLATLKSYDTFGEDSLISGEPRNCTVTMLTDGVLLRLARAKFHKFIKDAIIAHLSLEAAQQMNDQELVWLDVRHSEAFEQGHLAGSTNIPFFSLRMMLPTLDRNKQYLLICDTGHLSEAAAFLLIRHEFSAYVLTDGLRNIPADQLIKGTNPTNSSSSLACEEKTEFPVSTSGFTHAASRNLDEAWKTLSPSDEIPRGSELQGSETQSPKSPMEAEPTAQNLTTPNAVEPKTTASPPSSETIVAKFIEIDSETAFEELEFLPTQPDAETLKARLRDAEAEIKRLRGECEGLKYKLIGAENSLRTPLPEVHQKSSLLSELVRSLIIAFILTALILAGLLIFSPGQELLKQWLA